MAKKKAKVRLTRGQRRERELRGQLEATRTLAAERLARLEQMKAWLDEANVKVVGAESQIMVDRKKLGAQDLRVSVLQQKLEILFDDMREELARLYEINVDLRAVSLESRHATTKLATDALHKNLHQVWNRLNKAMTAAQGPAAPSGGDTEAAKPGTGACCMPGGAVAQNQSYALIC